MDKFDALKSFVEVAHTESFTKAAEQLDINRVLVTRQVKELEDWLNIRLLNRTTRRVSLTAPGHDVMAHCERILDEVAGLQALASSHNENLMGEIRLASPIGLAQNMLLDAVQAFCKLHPNVTIEFVVSDSHAKLVDERIDIALRFTEQPDEKLIARPLISIASAICASPNYISSNQVITEPAQLPAHNCLIHLAHNKWRFIENEALTTVKVSGNFKANDVGVLVKAALNHQGLVNLPCDIANPLLASEQLIQVLPSYALPKIPLWAVYLSRSYQRPVVRAFIDFLCIHWDDDINVFQSPDD